VVILAASSISGPTLQEVGLSVKDWLAHLVEYSVLGFLSYRWRRAEGHRPGTALLGSMILAAAMGAIDENYQRLIPGRITSWTDYAADLVGAGLGSGVATVYYTWTGRFRDRVDSKTPGSAPGGGEER
jgi:VanZ family protein